MNSYKRRSALTWCFLAFLFYIFNAWYTGFDATLTKTERYQLLDKLNAQDPSRNYALIRKLLEEDNGQSIHIGIRLNYRQFFDLADDEISSKSQKELLTDYNHSVFRYLIKNGSYPISLSNFFSISNNHSNKGHESNFSERVIIRFRSKRVLLEMITDPFFDAFQPHHVAGSFSIPSTILVVQSFLQPAILLILIIAGVSIQAALFTKYKKAKLIRD